MNLQEKEIIEYGAEIRRQLLGAVSNNKNTESDMCVEDMIIEDYINMRIATDKIDKLYTLYPAHPIYDNRHKDFIYAIQLHNGTVKVHLMRNDHFVYKISWIDTLTKRCIINRYMKMNHFHMFPVDKSKNETYVRELTEAVESLKKMILKSSSAVYYVDDIFDHKQGMRIERIYLNVNSEIICHLSDGADMSILNFSKLTVDDIIKSIKKKISDVQ